MSIYRLKWRGKKLWFKSWTAIGPSFTDKIREAETFTTEEEAQRHPAYYHPTSLVDVREYRR